MHMKIHMVGYAHNNFFIVFVTCDAYTLTDKFEIMEQNSYLKVGLAHHVLVYIISSLAVFCVKGFIEMIKITIYQNVLEDIAAHTY